MGKPPCYDKINGLKKGPWTSEEDQKLIEYITKHGACNWRTLPKNAGLQRCGKSCRLRWINYLRPDIKRGRFSFEEEETIIQLHSLLGNKWSTIAARLPGRTDNEIKNFWNTYIRKRLLRMGIDPVTHSPRLDLLDLSSILNHSLYNSSQMDIKRLFDVHQNLINPEIPRLATSLTSTNTQNNQTQNFATSQNGRVKKHQYFNAQIGQNQYEQENIVQPSQFEGRVIQEIPSSMTTNCNIQYGHETQVEDPNFRSTNSRQLSNEWQSGNVGLASNLISDQDEYNLILQGYNDFYGSNQATILDPQGTNSGFIASNFSFYSVVSTPASSPTPLNSNSTTTYAEDDRESYCSNMLQFEIPESLDVCNFM